MARMKDRLPALIAALTALGLVGAFLVPHRFRDGRDRNEAAAARALLALAQAEAVYHEGTGGYSGDLAALPASLSPDFPSRGLAGGYRFGSVEIDETGRPILRARRFAYYAVPETYHVTGILTLLVGPEGKVYAKDAGSSLPPSAWPASDPTSEGWIILDR